MDKQLGFIIIGAQKSGTTSLHKYLSCHPQIWMPSEKEAPFFSQDELYNKGWDRYSAEYFYDAPHDKIWGKATPHYMIDMRVPGRIAKLMPEVKLIVLLRHPLKRALSHYKMLVRLGVEHRTFEIAIKESLRESSLKIARTLSSLPENEERLIVTNGEYGRIMEEYLKYFDKEQLLILFTDDLKDNPKLILEKVYFFLCISTDYLSPNIGKIYHMGGVRMRFPQIENLRQVAYIRATWHILPERFRRNLMYWFNQWRAIPDKENESSYISYETTQLLKTHYKKDIELFESLFGLKTPWVDIK
ncbi:MAG: sulfotransferase [Deltaproteobacteria bacterium]|nr:sulfotransferase [Deltaproteobacteria bacterium]